jgi:signal transduction histidine kinase
MMSKLNPKQIIQGAYSSFIYQAKLKDINYSLEIDKAIPDIIISDSDRIKQLLQILIYNALKYTS